MPRMLSYDAKGTFIHSLSGTTKLLFFLSWSMVGMLTYDTRVLAFMLVVSLLAFRIAKVEYKEISFVFKLILVFLLINIIAIFIFSPEEGVKIYSHRTVLEHIAGRYYITSEQLFYEANVALKYFTVIPIALLFILTTNPSEFASSLNKLGISYKICYSVTITLRYIPDMQRDYTIVSQAQQARGIDISKKVNLLKRIKNVTAVLLPLFLSSMEQIETISNALELRGFGKRGKRTWYAARAFKMSDYIVISVLIIFAVLAFYITFYDGSRFYNPFIK
ncbi:MAG: energy-coupling factor transporter transmembrane component T family protein [Ruminiclostridium sp.]